MKHFFMIFSLLLAVLFINDLLAQPPVDYGILGSQTHSGSEGGHERAARMSNPSSSSYYKITILDVNLDIKQSMEARGIEFSSLQIDNFEMYEYRANIKNHIKKPYVQESNFNLTKQGGSNTKLNWSIIVPHNAKRSTVSLVVEYKENHAFKVLDINPNKNKEKLVLSINFHNERVSVPGYGTVSFDEKFVITGNRKSIMTDDIGAVTLMVEKM